MRKDVKDDDVDALLESIAKDARLEAAKSALSDPPGSRPRSPLAAMKAANDAIARSMRRNKK